MRVQHGYRIARTDFEPALQLTDIAGIQRVQYEWGECEIVYPIDLPGDLDLLLIMGMDFDEHFNSKCVRLGFELGDECEGLGNHETARARLFDGVTSRVQAYTANARGLKLLQNPVQVEFPGRIP